MEPVPTVAITSYTAYAITLGGEAYQVPASLVRLDSDGNPTIAMRASTYMIQKLFKVKHTLASCDGFKSVQHARNVMCGLVEPEPVGEQLFDPLPEGEQPQKTKVAPSLIT